MSEDERKIQERKITLMQTAMVCGFIFAITFLTVLVCIDILLVQNESQNTQIINLLQKCPKLPITPRG